MTDSQLPPGQQPQPYQQPPVYPQQFSPPQPGYVQNIYAPQPPRGLSVSSLVIGIVSFFLGFTVLIPLVGLILGIAGLRKEPAGRGMAIAGIWINAIILVAGLVIAGLIIAAILGFGAFTIPFIVDSGVTYDAL